ncbi:hypothetical protein A2U01_0000586, partial [Trifolium medium]|nr:hypothetical protein [Trifolium medium]
QERISLAIPPILRVSPSISPATTKNRFRPYSGTEDPCRISESYDSTSQIAILTTLPDTTRTC